jgi:divalent metal cation (Fe/Co/Zn/Cd) transporter
MDESRHDSSRHDSSRHDSIPQRIALASVVAAGVLVAIKLVVGLLSNSLGALAEAIHSATDLVAALARHLCAEPSEVAEVTVRARI